MVADLSEKLKQLRNRNHYSQKELANLLCLSPSIISVQSAEPSGRRCVSERPLCGAKRPPQIA